MERHGITDLNLSAYLLLKGYKCHPQKNGKYIIFNFRGPNLQETIQSYYDNPKIPVLDFVEKLKTVRSILFNLKNQEVPDTRTRRYPENDRL